jgi:hypothetical protein
MQVRFVFSYRTKIFPGKENEAVNRFFKASRSVSDSGFQIGEGQKLTCSDYVSRYLGLFLDRVSGDD